MQNVFELQFDKNLDICNQYKDRLNSMLLERAVIIFELQVNSGIVSVSIAKPKTMKQRGLVVTFGSYDEVSPSNEFLNLAFSEPYQLLLMLVLKLKLCQKTSETIVWVLPQFMLLNNPRDVKRIGPLG